MSARTGQAPTHNRRDDSDAEEEALANDYQQQVQYDDGYNDDMDNSGPGVQDLQSQLIAAAQPLEYGASLESKIQSYDSYCRLFHYVLNSDGPVDLEVPSFFWAWEVIDEFIYQFNTFCSYRQRLAKKQDNEEDLTILRENPNTWGCYSVLNVLYSLIQRFQISEQLAAKKRGEDSTLYAGEYGNKPMYQMLGYFSVIGLLRVHCLLGDFTLALKTLDDLELNKKSMFARVMAAHFTTYYYIGFSYMMMHRYADAIRMFTHILVYVSRTKNFQKGAQYDAIAKNMEQMYALVAICVALHPTRLDDAVHVAVKEKYGDQFALMQRGGPESLSTFVELYKSACPKFISPTPPDFENPSLNVDPIDHQCNIFMQEVKNNMFSPQIRSYLKLYTTVDVHKLAGFLDGTGEQDGRAVTADEIRSRLLVNKQHSRQVRHDEGGLLDGDVVNSSDLDYAMIGDLIQVSEAKVGRRLVDWYLRNLARTY